MRNAYKILVGPLYRPSSR